LGFLGTGPALIHFSSSCSSTFDFHSSRTTSSSCRYSVWYVLPLSTSLVFLVVVSQTIKEARLLGSVHVCSQALTPSSILFLPRYWPGACSFFAPVFSLRSLQGPQALSFCLFEFVVAIIRCLQFFWLFWRTYEPTC
jgi:hypothetical protein